MQITLKNLDQFNAYFRQPTLHPMVGVGDLSCAALSLFEPIDFDAYCVILMESDFGELIIDGVSIHYTPGTMFTLRPGKVVSMKLSRECHPRGKMLLFRKEMIENTGLGRDFYMFNFFDFSVSDALWLDEAELKVMLNCYANIDAELHAANDELTGHMLRLGIGQMLSYCKRYYERQFDTRTLRPSEMMLRLESLLESYFAPGSDMPRRNGFPTVAWCASQFHLAPNSFGNMVRRNMHISAKQYIHGKIIDRAKALLSNPDLSVDQVADALGFTYSNHFSRLFRKETGMTPSQFRSRP